MNTRLAYETGTATDALNEAFVRVEAQLEELNLGVTATILLSDGRELAYEKRARWGLILKTSKEEKPLLESGRKNRVDAAHAMNRLFDALLTAAKQQQSDVRGAIEALEVFSDRLTAFAR